LNDHGGRLQKRIEAMDVHDGSIPFPVKIFLFVPIIMSKYDSYKRFA
jgi:hypothetical protein